MQNRIPLDQENLEKNFPNMFKLFSKVEVSEKKHEELLRDFFQTDYSCLHYSVFESDLEDLQNFASNKREFGS